eukprot:2158393-Pyramimonas_sp.AAC.2
MVGRKGIAADKPQILCILSLRADRISGIMVSVPPADRSNDYGRTDKGWYLPEVDATISYHRDY